MIPTPTFFWFVRFHEKALRVNLRFPCWKHFVHLWARGDVRKPGRVPSKGGRTAQSEGSTRAVEMPTELVFS
jgi:hypothetical protein